MKPDDIADIVEAAVKPLIARIKELEAREIPAPVSLDTLEARIKELEGSVAEYADKLDGNSEETLTIIKSVQDIKSSMDSLPIALKVDDLKPEIEKQVNLAVSALPKPEDGKSVTIDDVSPLINDAVSKAVSSAIDALPKPKDGKDGLGMAGAMIDRDGNLQITMTDGTVKDLGRVEGKDGQDGVSLDSLEREYLTETHEIRETWTVAGRKKELTYPAGGIRHGGYWADGTKAVAGSVWNLHGNAFIAIKDTSSKPDVGASDWALFVRKGKDGETIVREKRENKPIKLSGTES